MPKKMNAQTSAERTVRLFRNGRNQAVRIPREFEFEGNEAIMRQEGDMLIIEPVPTDGLLALLSRLRPIEDEFPNVDEGLPALDDVRL
jgi:antitoxin VapB